MNKCADGIQFLPGGQERVLDFGQFGGELVDESTKIGHIVDESNRNAEVEVVVLSLHHGDRIILNIELVRLDVGCLFGHGEAGTFLRAKGQG